MSDSLKATVIVSELVLTISANPELELLDDEDPPRLPAVSPPVEDVPLDVEEDDELEEPPDEPADTLSPGVRLDSEAIVPLVGA
jgi:hypothetical protein